MTTLLIAVAAMAVALVLAVALHMRTLARELADENWFMGGGHD